MTFVSFSNIYYYDLIITLVRSYWEVLRILDEVIEETSEAADGASSVASDVETEAALDPASPYCVALDEFLVASDSIQQDSTTIDDYIASMTNLRDQAPTEEMRTSLTTAIDAVNSADAATFESALNEVVFDLGLDAVKCGIE